MNTKKLIITMCNADAGDVIATNQKDRVLPFDRLEPNINKWIQSLLRGVRQNKDLSLMITIKSDIQPQQKNSLFDVY